MLYNVTVALVGVATLNLALPAPPDFFLSIKSALNVQIYDNPYHRQAKDYITRRNETERKL